MFIKKFLTLSFIALLACSSLQKLSAAKYSLSFGGDTSWTGSTAWKDSGGNGITGYPASGSDISLIATANNKILTYNVASGYYLNSLEYNSAQKVMMLTLSTDLTIEKDFTRVSTSTGTIVFRGADKTVLIKGNIYAEANSNEDSRLCWGHSTNNPALGKLTVNNNVTLNSGYWSSNVVNGVNIGGYMDLQAGNSNHISGNAYLNYWADSASTRSTRMGALKGGDGSAGKGGVYSTNVATVASQSHLTFTGIGTQTFTYGGATSNASVANANARLHIIMAASNAGFTQVLSGANSYTGNTILTKGNLKFKASTTAIGDIFIGYDTTSSRNATTDVIDMANLVSNGKMTSADTSIEFDGAGASAKNISWAAGSIGMDLNGLNSGDVILNATALYLYGANNFFFDFENAIKGQTYHLMSLTSVNLNGSAITEGTKEAFLEKLASNYGSGKDFFSYDIATGALTFTAGDLIVPEPSTYAAIFGALALAFAAYKRRQKK